MSQVTEKNSIKAIKKVLKDYFGDSFSFNEQLQLFSCPFCFVMKHENNWGFTVIHSSVRESWTVENCMYLILALSKVIDNLEIMQGIYINQNNIKDEIDFNDIIDAGDVWDYMDEYDVDEDFALAAITSRLIEAEKKEILN